MTPAATKTPVKETFRSFGPLNFEVVTHGYHSPPAVNWLENESVGMSLQRINYEQAVFGASDLGALPLRTIISGWQVNAGASASLQPARLIGMVVDQIGTGDFTFIELDADDLSVGDRMREITSARALVESRLDTLSALSSGWLDGDGVTPTPEAVAAARRLIWILLNCGIERPRLAPTPDGGVEAEWSEDHREVSVTFEPDGRLYGNAVDVATGKISEPLLRPDDHRAVADFVLGA
jgi:hypothetical protein